MGLAALLGLAHHRLGPPCARIGRRILYRAEAVRDGLAAREGKSVGAASKNGSRK
jgi:hypothetical protein